MTLKDLFQEAVQKYGTQALAAKAIGIDRTRISKVLSGDDDAKESLELGNCLRLARALGRQPSEVLLANGKADDHLLIAELYGVERPASELSHEERQTLALLRQDQGFDELTQAVRDDDALGAIEAYQRLLNQVTTNLLVGIEDSRYLLTPSDPKHYWSQIETYIQQITEENVALALEKGMDEAFIGVLRQQLHDAVAAREALPENDELMNAEWADPDLEPLRRLYGDTVLGRIERLEEADRERRDMAQIEAIADPVERSQRRARYRRVLRLLFHDGLIAWADERLGKFGEADERKRQVVRYKKTLQQIADASISLPPSKERRRDMVLIEPRANARELLDRVGREIAAIDAEFDFILRSDIKDGEAIPRLRDLRHRREQLRPLRDQLHDEVQVLGGRRVDAFRQTSAHGATQSVTDQVLAPADSETERLATFWSLASQAHERGAYAHRVLTALQALQATGRHSHEPDPSRSARIRELAETALAQATDAINAATPDDDLPMRRMTQELRHIRTVLEGVLQQYAALTDANAGKQPSRRKQRAK